MSRLRQIATDTRLYPVWVLLFAAAVIFIRLGSYGFWEPNEVQVADRANEIAHPDAGEVSSPAVDGKEPRPKPKKRQTRSQFSEELIAKSIVTSGRGEFSSRAPLALLALLTIIATYFIGLRVAGPRAGLFSAAILLTFPALLMHGRHLNSEIGSAAGSALVVLGLLGLLSKRGFGFRKTESPSVLLYPIDALLVILGALLCYRAAGALLGVLPPFAAVGIAASLFILKTRAGDRIRHCVASGIGLGSAAVAFAVFFTAVFDLVDPDEINAANQDKIAKGAVIEPTTGYAVLGGQDVTPTTDYTDGLGGVWRKKGDRRVGFSTTLESIAVGTFPWIALIPIAIIVLLLGRGQKESASRTAIALWALAAFVAGAVFARKVGVAMYPAWGALAAAAGVWLADIFSPKQPEPRVTDDESGNGALPLAAFFVVCAAVVIGKDILAFPEKLTSLNLTGGKLEFPDGVGVQFAWVVVGWASALSIGALLALRGKNFDEPADAKPAKTRSKWAALLGEGARFSRACGRAVQRGGLIAALGLGLLGALVFAQVLTPSLSKKLSSKNILGVYQDLRQDGDVLGIMGRAGGASYYAGTDFERIRGRTQLLAFLERPERVFALAPTTERCPLNKAARKKGLPYFVVDDSSAQYLLFSNRLASGEKDVNPLSSTFFKERPANIRKPLAWNLDNRIELVGVSMPDSVRKGATFKMKLFFKVNKAISRNWKVFVHFDQGVKINNDHEPIGGTCGTAYWLPGDYIVDEFEANAGSRSHPTGAYKVWVGFFVGSGGNFTNMKVVTPGADEHNRIPLGTINLR